MDDYQKFATWLEELLGPDQSVRITAPGYMPLSVERIGASGDGRPLIAISHTGVQNGDLMRDPELVFEHIDLGDGLLGAEPISFRNDYLGAFSEVYRYDDQGRRTHVRPVEKADLRRFARHWFSNLRSQGFFSGNASRERLA